MSRARPLSLLTAWTFAALCASPARTALASPTSTELVRQGAAHEADHHDDIAARRYTEALSLDPTDGAAYLALGALRLRLGDAHEAESVYSVALARLPGFLPALLGRARARWATGWHLGAETDLQMYTNDSALTEPRDALLLLAEWLAADAQRPAQLATWRRLLTVARAANDDALAHRAKTMVVALTLLVDTADPASHPETSDSVRRGLAIVARRRP